MLVKRHARKQRALMQEVKKEKEKLATYSHTQQTRLIMLKRKVLICKFCRAVDIRRASAVTI
jgi:hypothetical protein